MTDRLRELLDPTPGKPDRKFVNDHVFSDHGVSSIDGDLRMSIGTTIDLMGKYRTALVRETCELLMRKCDDAAEIKGDMDDPMIQARNMIGFWMMEATKEPKP